MRAINGTLRAAAPIDCRIGPRGIRGAHGPRTTGRIATPPRGAAPPVARTMEPSRDADAVSNLDRSKSCVKQSAPAAIRLFLCTASPRARGVPRAAHRAAAVERRCRLSADSDRPHVMSDNEFSARRLAARYR
ncbi:hypothetical protein Bamb_3788 [Burkholderia ambifaria AMMD]|uniref:Uncharacterized protein n=1 Tax=Burkholderia ambifaria (strain ATCC BAA-244 / DSM 16087 / CCUG 44356 / LMG 19182 / AMMD) TaxID=339670 RepID=Q0B931_BURCM|nr:hypothetical protein Bamb_3788 [Burkholderia ambifaria AMMD]